MKTLNSISAIIRTLSIHALEYNCSTIADYINDVVMSGRSKYSEDYSLYLHITYAMINA